MDSDLTQPDPLPEPEPLPVEDSLPIEAPVMIDITETSKSKRLLPEQIYRERCRPIAIDEITYEMLETFLTELAKTGLWEMSANRVGLNARILKKIKAQDERFATMCNDSMEQYIETVETECHRRAVEGWDEPVFSHKTGANIGTIRRHDGRLLELLLKRHRKEYKDGYEAPTLMGQAVMVVPLVARSQEEFMQMAEMAAKDATRPALPPGEDRIIDQSPTP